MARRSKKKRRERIRTREWTSRLLYHYYTSIPPQAKHLRQSDRRTDVCFTPQKCFTSLCAHVNQWLACSKTYSTHKENTLAWGNGFCERLAGDSLDVSITKGPLFYPCLKLLEQRHFLFRVICLWMWYKHLNFLFYIWLEEKETFVS